MIESPAVSGARNYKELCLATKREERRLNEIKKKQQYLMKAGKPQTNFPTKSYLPSQNWRTTYRKPGNKLEKEGIQQKQKQLRCYICDSPNHLARQCQKSKTESAGGKLTQTKTPSKTSGPGTNYVIRDNSHSNIKGGSRCVQVNIEGVSITGIIDTGSDVTILRGDAFYSIVSKSDLNVHNLKAAEQVKACTYDQKPISLDGQLNMKVSFGEKVINATVYIKLIAPDQLLLSEKVCHMLGIVSYHPSVKFVDKSQPVVDVSCAMQPKGPISCNSGASVGDQSGSELANHQVSALDGNNSDTATVKIALSGEASRQFGGDEQASLNVSSKGVKVTLTAVVSLIRTMRLPAYHSAVVPVKVKDIRGSSVLVEADKSLDDCLQVDDSLVMVDQDGFSTIMVSNNSKSTYQLKSGMELAGGSEVEPEVTDGKDELLDQITSSEADISCSYQSSTDEHEVVVRREDRSNHETAQGQLPEQLKLWMVTLSNDTDCSVEHKQWRQQQLRKTFIQPRRQLSEEESLQMSELLGNYHDIFSLSDDERGETDLMEFSIDTGSASPKRQAARRIPFAARQEITSQLDKMQRNNVVKPSESPWASPVVLVRKKEGTLRFCVDYRTLNSVTKPDLFPLPRINDLLDQLGKSKFFSTLDLKSGYWQIRISADSQEKTAFITHQGLYQFRVMPFGVTNAPAVFRRLMQQVLTGLQTSSGNDFVSVYLDDVIVFSETLQDHTEHLRAVFDRIRRAGLKLNPSKCKILCEEVEYLGHIVTPHGLQPNNRNLEAVRSFPQPYNLRQLRQFLGLTSYYRRFIPRYAKLAHPLHALTRKGAVFNWSAECEIAFDTLRDKLSTSPLLAYPNFNRDFTLETDASKLGLGAILSQYQVDQKLHPIAYASRSISNAEANYAVTDLETLAVVWAVTHFRYYLYGHSVTIITDHAAVKAILGAPNLTGRHARWWSKLYGSGIKQIDIVRRSGKMNLHADCLSRQPVMTIPSDEDSNTEVQIAQISCEASDTIDTLLQEEPRATDCCNDEISDEQFKDPELQLMICYLKEEVLPEDTKLAKKVVTESVMYAIVNDILYYVGPKQMETSRVAVPQQMRQRIMQEYHDGRLAGHFSGPKLYKTLVRSWWWPRMYSDALEYASMCHCTRYRETTEATTISDFY